MADDLESVQFDILFPLRDSAGLETLLSDQLTPGTADYQRWLTPEEFAARFGATPATLASAQTLLTQSGFQITKTYAQGIRVAGTVGTLRQHWGMTLDHVVSAAGETLVARGGLTLPAGLQALGAQVVAFNGPIRARIHASRLGHPVPLNRISDLGAYWFTDLKQAYDAPSYQALAGAGRNIAILMSGDVEDTDMLLYFGHERLAPPELVHVPVNGGAPFSASSDGSFEATLDVQQAGGMAPQAATYLYNVQDLSDGSIEAGLIQAVTDNIADVLSMSFGACELLYTAAYNGGVDQTGVFATYTQLFQQGNAQGMTFVASSGDFGALQCPSAKKAIYVAGASHPATSPNVTGVGGTNLVTTFTPGSPNSAYVAENAEGDPLVPTIPDGGTLASTGGYWGSGGGPSIIFPAPSWQPKSLTTVTMRATPDLSLHMGGCPTIAAQPCGHDRSADIEILGGEGVGVIGTSASAPAFAGVVALYDQYTNARHGNLNPYIYQMGSSQGYKGTGSYRRTISGFNGVYYSNQPVVLPGITLPTIPIYNMVIGNGSLDIRQFLGAMSLPAAGVPGTPSNP